MVALGTKAAAEWPGWGFQAEKQRREGHTPRAFRSFYKYPSNSAVLFAQIRVA